MGTGSPINQADIEEAQRHFRAVYLDAQLSMAERPYQRMMNEVPVSGKTYEPKFASRSSGVHEWLDERIFTKLRNYGFSIPVKKYADGLEISLEDLEDDQENLNLYDPNVRELADNHDEHKQELIDSLKTLGFAGSLGLSYDGQYFYDSDHKDHPEAPTNDNVTTDLLDADAFKSLRAKMRLIRKPNGQLANVRPTDIEVPAALESTAKSLFEIPFLTGGATNDLFNAVNVIVNPRIDAVDPKMWFLYDLSKPIKPFCMPKRTDITFHAQTDMSQGDTFDRDVVKFGTRGRYGAGYYFYQLTAASDGSGS